MTFVLPGVFRLVYLPAQYRDLASGVKMRFCDQRERDQVVLEGPLLLGVRSSGCSLPPHLQQVTF